MAYGQLAGRPLVNRSLAGPRSERQQVRETMPVGASQRVMGASASHLLLLNFASDSPDVVSCYVFARRIALVRVVVVAATVAAPLVARDANAFNMQLVEWRPVSAATTEVAGLQSNHGNNNNEHHLNLHDRLSLAFLSLSLPLSHVVHANLLLPWP